MLTQIKINKAKVFKEMREITICFLFGWIAAGQAIILQKIVGIQSIPLYILSLGLFIQCLGLYTKEYTWRLMAIVTPILYAVFSAPIMTYLIGKGQISIGGALLYSLLFFIGMAILMRVMKSIAPK